MFEIIFSVFFVIFGLIALISFFNFLHENNKQLELKKEEIELDKHFIQKTKDLTETKQPNFKLGSKSMSNLNGVNPLLKQLMERAITEVPYDFQVFEGIRTKERQAKLVKQGVSKTMNSKHLIGNAVDLVVFNDKGQLTWDDKYLYKYKANAAVIKKIANEMCINVAYGGDWKSFKDYPHWEL